jgi:hypothetical protein
MTRRNSRRRVRRRRAGDGRAMPRANRKSTTRELLLGASQLLEVSVRTFLQRIKSFCADGANPVAFFPSFQITSERFQVSTGRSCVLNSRTPFRSRCSIPRLLIRLKVSSLVSDYVIRPITS